MKKPFALLLAAVLLSACGENTSSSDAHASDSASEAKIVTAPARYDAGGVTAKSVAAFDSNWQQPHPVVLVIPEWWGLNDYPVSRARQLADLGYFALAVDMYGEGKATADPKEAGQLAGAFYQDTALVKQRLTAALQALRNFPQADTQHVAIIGYCFGGSMGLLAAKMHLPLRGVVSFHGSLKGTAGKTDVPILVCQGEADQFSTLEDAAAWRKTMDSLGVAYTFKTYPGATHAFTNPAATEAGKRLHMPIEYNAAADTASWEDMKEFLEKHLR